MVTMMAMAVDQIPDEDIASLTFRCDIFLNILVVFFVVVITILVAMLIIYDVINYQITFSTIVVE